MTEQNNFAGEGWIELELSPPKIAASWKQQNGVVSSNKEQDMTAVLHWCSRSFDAHGAADTLGDISRTVTESALCDSWLFSCSGL